MAQGSPHESGGGQDDEGAIQAERRQLTGLAYRMLGSLADAEDVVQEAFVRWYDLTPEQRAAIQSPGAWRWTVASRVCLDILSSARVRHESYVGEWIPEPVSETDQWVNGRPGESDPFERVTLDESVNMAFLVVLEAMTPAERVSFILHDVYRFSFAEVANIVGRTPAACRQLASSARRRVRASLNPPPSSSQQRVVVAEFREAWARHDLRSLIELLDPDAVAIADGGGLADAVHDPIQGAERIAHYAVGLARAMPDGTSILEQTVNGQPGLVLQQDGVTTTVLAFACDGGRITHIWAIRNPEKLRTWLPTNPDTRR